LEKGEREKGRGTGSGRIWPAAALPPAASCCLGRLLGRGEIENEVRVFWEMLAVAAFILAKIMDGRRIETDGRDRPETAMGHFEPMRDGAFPAQAQVAAWDARGGGACARLLGRVFLSLGRKRQLKKTTARTLLGHAAGPLRASCRAGRAWAWAEFGPTAQSTQFFRFSFSRSYN